MRKGFAPLSKWNSWHFHALGFEHQSARLEKMIESSAFAFM
jgi:hypothetical protein